MRFLCKNVLLIWIFDTFENLCYHKEVGALQKECPDFFYCRILPGQKPRLYIFSGTVTLNMVSTLAMTVFTATHSPSRACCKAGSAS